MHGPMNVQHSTYDTAKPRQPTMHCTGTAQRIHHTASYPPSKLDTECRKNDNMLN